MVIGMRTRKFALLTVLILPVVVPACVTQPGQENKQLDFNAIAKLHQRDAEASKKGDFKTLRSLMTDDAVMMPPGEPWIRGAEALDENRRRMADAMRDVEVTEYVFDFEEVVVLGEYAFEWGTVRGAMRSKADPTAPADSSAYKLLRILKKEGDGEWRVHRAIWNAAPLQ